MVLKWAHMHKLTMLIKLWANKKNIVVSSDATDRCKNIDGQYFWISDGEQAELGNNF